MLQLCTNYSKLKLPTVYSKQAVRKTVQNIKVERFLEWLKIQAKEPEQLQGEHSFLGKSAVEDQGLMTQNPTSFGTKRNFKMRSDIIMTKTTVSFQKLHKLFAGSFFGSLPRY